VGRADVISPQPKPKAAVQDSVHSTTFKIPKGGEANLVELPVLDTVQTSIQEMPPQGPEKAVVENPSSPENKGNERSLPPTETAAVKAHKIYQAHFILSMALNLALRF
jgi:hypothetical protein